MASTIKVDNVQNQPGTNVVSKCGTDITLGASGDTVALASGASATGFGATGAVNWDTASIKTATFTAVSGSGYFCNTTGGIFNITMPASPSAGDIVGLKDYAGTFATYTLTIDRNGSKLDGVSTNKGVNVANTSLTLIYVDGTQGWKSIEEGTGEMRDTFVVATGGNSICSCGNYKIHTFTGPGTFCVSQVSGKSANNAVAYMVVAGGAGGSGSPAPYAGGGGAGGFREGTTSSVVPYAASPIVAATGITVTASPYSITVGGGGSVGGGSYCRGGSGSDSTFSTITSAGGGGGGIYPAEPAGIAGGSGGGGAANAGAAGAGDTPSTTPDQGFAGGAGSGCSGGGGGGATTVGATGGPNPVGNAGGTGATTHIPGSPITKAAGGHGYGASTPPVAGGCNTGNGAAGAPATGGSGIVVIRYKAHD